MKATFQRQRLVRGMLVDHSTSSLDLDRLTA
jgi:hypothetical protein